MSDTSTSFGRILGAGLVGLVLGILMGARAAFDVVECDRVFAKAAVACGGTDDPAPCRAQAADDYVACEGDGA